MAWLSDIIYIHEPGVWLFISGIPVFHYPKVHGFDPFWANFYIWCEMGVDLDALNTWNSLSSWPSIWLPSNFHPISLHFHSSFIKSVVFFSTGLYCHCWFNFRLPFLTASLWTETSIFDFIFTKTSDEAWNSVGINPCLCEKTKMTSGKRFQSKI